MHAHSLRQEGALAVVVERCIECPEGEQAHALRAVVMGGVKCGRPLSTLCSAFVPGHVPLHAITSGQCVRVIVALEING